MQCAPLNIRLIRITGLDESQAAVSDKELISSVVQQQPAQQHFDGADDTAGLTRSGSGGVGGVGLGSINPLSAKTVLFVLAASAVAVLTLAVSVGVICRIQCKMRSSPGGSVATTPTGSSNGIGVGGSGGVMGPSTSSSAAMLLRSGSADDSQQLGIENEMLAGAASDEMLLDDEGDVAVDRISSGTYKEHPPRVKKFCMT